MSFALLAPLGLFALAAFALPLLIHLVRRLELTTTEFAALRWVAERVRPRRRLRFERPWLLLLRLALLALLALLLARPVLLAPAAPTRPWVVVAPGAERNAAHAAVSAVTADWHWLAPGFPRWDEAVPSENVPLSSLLRELDADLPAQTALTVIVPQELAGLDGERPRLAHALDWRVVPGHMQGSDPTASATPVRLAVRYAADAEAAVAYLRAAVAAWNLREPHRYELDAEPASAAIPDDASWLVWLAPSTPALTQWIERGGIALVAGDANAGGQPIWHDGHGRAIAHSESSGRGKRIALGGAFVPSDLPILLDADFPDRLLAAFAGAPRAPTRAPAAAARPSPEAGTASAEARSLATAQPLDAWLALLIAALFLLERAVATRTRAQASA
jgi:hypothetical protein